MPLPDPRHIEREKYEYVYENHPNYKMGGARMQYAKEILEDEEPILSYLDVGCGRGEMLDFVKSLGTPIVQGTEIVSSLCERPDVVEAHGYDLPFSDGQFEVVTMFDVIEHVLPEDTIAVLEELNRVANRCVVVTAANFSHVVAGRELHINIKSYTEWNAIIEGVFADCVVYWLPRKYFKNETWVIYKC